MINRNSKLAAALAVLFELILIASAITKIISKQWSNLTLLLLAGIGILLPFIITYIANKKSVVLPSNFQLISLLFILLAEYFGEINRFYYIFWWWDLLLHAISGSYGVLTALAFMQGIITKDKETSRQRYAFLSLLFAFSFSIGLGTLWELFEFTGDYLFKTSMIKGGLEDTATDLIIKTLSALITSVICYYSLFINNKKFKFNN